MASETSSAGLKRQITLDGIKHDLIICTRQGNPKIMPYIKNELIQRTVGAWMKAYQAYASDLDMVINDYPLDGWDEFIIGFGLSEDIVADLFHKNEYNDICLQPSEGDPYVTVFNYTQYGMSITVTSRDNGQAGYDEAVALKAALEMMQDKAPSIFGRKAEAPRTSPDFRSEHPPMQEPPKEDPPPPPSRSGASQQGSQAQDAPQLMTLDKIWLRELRQFEDGVIGIERGQDKNFKDSATIETRPYNKDAVVQRPVYRLYKINAGMSIKQVISKKDGTQYTVLNIPIWTDDNEVRYNNIGIFKKDDYVHEGNTIPSEWRRVLQALGLYDNEAKQYHEAVAIGSQFKIGVGWAVYICMEFNPKNQGFPKFIGFYSGAIAESQIESKTIDFPRVSDDIPF